MAKKDCITQTRLKELFNYDPDTGNFIRKVGVKGAGAGTVAGCVQGTYWHIRIDYVVVKAHHLVWLYVHGRYPEYPYVIDHINGDPIDNRLCNLREVHRDINSINRHRPSKTNVSGFCGVTKAENRWRVRYRGKHIGKYKLLSVAIKARKIAEIKDPLHPRVTL